MPLAPGTSLGPYEVREAIGAGGMGEVYRATDTRLNRDVALKALPDALAADPDRVSRFKREAQVLASLNHPNVAAIYGLEETPVTGADQSGSSQAPLRALVMELVDGPTLAERLTLGPLALEEVIAIARQIAEAIEYAHEQGVVHRDLKPANIKLRPDGTVKVLDFGLAKALEQGSGIGDRGSAAYANSPTLSLAATQAGLILGTAAYMSPEQAKGKPADRRADIWSFGIVLFEMLAGRSVYSGETVSETMAAVIMKEPDWACLPATAPPRLRALLRRCLVKDPRSRLQAIGEARIALEQGAQDPAEGPAAVASPVPAKGRGRGRPIALAGASLVVGALAAGYAAWTLKPVPARTLTQFAVLLPDTQQFSNPGRQMLALSRDGTNLVYVANQRLFVRSMSGLETREVSGSVARLGGVTSPVFSPDGQTIVFFSNADRSLKRLALTGGTAVTVCPAANPFGMSWDEHGIVFGQDKGIMRVSETGGVPEVIAAVETGQVAGSPQMLPGGRAVLFSLKNIADSWDNARVVVQPLEGGSPKTVLEGGADARYLPTGHLVYAISGSLFAVPFDLESLATIGVPAPILEGVRRSGTRQGTTGAAQFGVSATGTLAYIPGPVAVSGSQESDLALAIFDRQGKAQHLNLPPGAYRSPRVSPDGKGIAFETEDEKEAVVWVYELAGANAPRRLTFGGNNRHALWSADGQWVAFQSDREGDLAIFRQRADGSGTAERLTRPESGAIHDPQSWSPDGAHLLLGVSKDKQWSLWTMTASDRQLKPVGGVQSVDPVEGTFSPDGRWVVYQAREGNTDRQVFLQPFPSTGAKYLVRAGGHPYWSPKGNELILNIGPAQSVVIPFAAAPRVAFGNPVDMSRVGRTEGNLSTSRRNADSMPDGEHIIGVANAGVPGVDLVPQITIVLNWMEELKQRVPAR